MKRKKGFTLVELLVSIILLALIGGIIIYNMSGVSKTNKETEYERYIASIKSAANVYADVNREIIESLYGERSYYKITIGDLIKRGLLEENTLNPYTEEYVGLNEEILLTLNPDTGGLSIMYPIDEEDPIIQGIATHDTFLVAMSDYVEYGEGYNCMQGAGSYELALSNDDGTLIKLSTEEIINEYEFKCEMPSNFNKDQAGSYEVKYTWVSKKGIPREQTRNLRVLEKVKPKFKYNDTYTEGTWYTPKYNGSTNKFEYLTIKPKLEGMDETKAKVRISKKSNDPNGAKVVITSSEDNNYVKEIKEYKVDEGDKTYELETIVYGHYNKEYWYEAKGSANIKQKLLVPEELVEGIGTNWGASKTIGVKETERQVEIEKYEYKIANTNSTLGRGQAVDNNNVFTKTTGMTRKEVTLLNGCTGNKEENKYIYIRAINKDGHVGEWSKALNIYLTNQVDLIISGDSNCISINNSNYSDMSCYYNSKNKYIKMGNAKFVVLGRTTDGRIYAAYDGVTDQKFKITTTKYGSFYGTNGGVQVLYYYKYLDTDTKALANEVQTIISKMPSNYANYLEYHTWESGSSDRYTSYVGNLTYKDWELYRGATNESQEYLVTPTSQYALSISDYTYDGITYGHSQAYNQDMTSNGQRYGRRIEKTIKNGSVIQNTSTSEIETYGKPVVYFKTINKCEGDGSAENPYNIGSVSPTPAVYVKPTTTTTTFTTKTYNLTLKIGTGISKIYYSTNNGKSYTEVTSSKVVPLPLGTNVKCYAEAKAGYKYIYNSASNTWSDYITTSGLTYSPSGTLEVYQIVCNYNGGSGSNPTSYNVNSSTITLNIPTRTGYTFAGWTGSNGSVKQISVSIPKGSTGNKTYTANWNPIYYNIVYNYNGGTGNNPTRYTIDQTITLSIPTKSGYSFTGWTGSNGSVKQLSVTIPKGSTEDKKYTANWKNECESVRTTCRSKAEAAASEATSSCGSSCSGGCGTSMVEYTEAEKQTQEFADAWTSCSLSGAQTAINCSAGCNCSSNDDSGCNSSCTNTCESNLQSDWAQCNYHPVTTCYPCNCEAAGGSAYSSTYSSCVTEYGCSG